MNGAMTNSPGSEYLFFDIGGVQYTCTIVSYLEAYSYFSGGITVRMLLQVHQTLLIMLIVEITKTTPS